MCGFDARDERSKLSAWMDRVAKETSLYYEEAHIFLNKVADKYDKQQQNSL